MTRKILLEALENVKLWKVKAWLIRRALQQGTARRGNHMVKATDTEISFYYRGILVARITLDDMSTHYPDLGIYRSTTTTYYQHKAIEDAVKEIRSIVYKGAEVHGTTRAAY